MSFCPMLSRPRFVAASYFNVSGISSVPTCRPCRVGTPTGFSATRKKHAPPNIRRHVSFCRCQCPAALTQVSSGAFRCGFLRAPVAVRHPYKRAYDAVDAAPRPTSGGLSEELLERGMAPT